MVMNDGMVQYRLRLICNQAWNMKRPILFNQDGILVVHNIRELIIYNDRIKTYILGHR